MIHSKTIIDNFIVFNGIYHITKYLQVLHNPSVLFITSNNPLFPHTNSLQLNNSNIKNIFI